MKFINALDQSFPSEPGSGTSADQRNRKKLTIKQARLLLVETSSHVDFSATRAFYTKHGFINEAKIRNYYDVGEDKLIFTKNSNRE